MASTINPKEVVRLYTKERWAMSKIAAHMDCSSTLVRAVLRERRVKVRRGGAVAGRPMVRRVAQ